MANYNFLAVKLATLLPPDSPFFRMSEGAQEKANNEACASALHVLFKIRDKPFDQKWTKARFVLNGDKHLMLYAEVFSAAVVGAFTAMHTGERFPNSRTSLNSDNAIIQAAEEAAQARIEDIETRQIAKRNGGNVEKATKPIGDRMDVDDNATPSKKGNHIQVDGANSRISSDMSAKIEQRTSMGSAPNSDTAPIDKPAEFDPEGPKHSRTAEYIAMQYTFTPPHPISAGADARHPSVVEFERQTGLKNVVGTGLHGKLTIHNRMRAVVDQNCLPEGKKTTWMDDEEKADYEAKRAKELAAIKAKEDAEQKKAADAQLLAEANHRERLKVMAVSMEHYYETDSEQENPPFGEAKGESSMPPPFDQQNLTTSSAAPTPTEISRKVKNRTIIPDSESSDSIPTKEQFDDIFNDAATPVRWYGRRHGSRRDSSVAVQENGSPMGLVTPHKMRPNSKRSSNPAPTMDEVAEKLSKPVTKPVSREQQRQTTEGIEELTGPREPAKPRPNVRTMPSKNELRFMSIEGLDKVKWRRKKKTEFDFTAGSSNAVSSNDSALIHPTPKSSPTPDVAPAPAAQPFRKRRRAESEASDTIVVHSPYFRSPAMGIRHGSRKKPPKQAKLRHSGARMESRISASPAPSLMSTAASDRPSRVKKPTKSQSLPTLMMDAPSSVAKPTRLMDTPSSTVKPPAKEKLTPIQKKLTFRGQTAVAAAIFKSETPSPRSSSFIGAIPDKESEEMLDKPVAVTDEEYIVEAILGHKTEHGGVYYHVKWEGWVEEKDNTWEPACNLHDAPDILNKYRQSLHVNGKVEDIASHRTVRKFDNQTKSLIRTFEYLVKWKASSKELNSWETEERVRQAGGVKKMIYHRIRKNITFGPGVWAKVKTAKAIKLLRVEGLEPEKGGRISAKEFAEALKEEDDRHELALAAREESV